ncbi:hypothetical protein M422DRAFT_241191 [Sphaerobolus stellatus SS14]|nr:hypothetical protein M422DRAFT_241191 [Sphaerobolus stellatus SS14]
MSTASKPVRFVQLVYLVITAVLVGNVGVDGSNQTTTSTVPALRRDLLVILSSTCRIHTIRNLKPSSPLGSGPVLSPRMQFVSVCAAIPQIPALLGIDDPRRASRSRGIETLCRRRRRSTPATRGCTVPATALPENKNV